MKRQEAEARGRRAELYAAAWLRAKGWRILDRRVKTSVGEIDLVAKRGKIIAFIEVKARATMDEAERSLDEYRLRRVADAARSLVHKYATKGEDVRIDAVYVAPGRLPRHLENVWQGG